nr:aldo/keto reductase [Paraburkholderia graminis]
MPTSRPGVIPWSPIGGGLLGGALKKASESTRRGFKEKVERFRPNLEAYEALCESLGEKPADIATAWLLHDPIVTAPIVGPRVVDQLTASLHALEIELPQETLDQLDKIWPGPGGEAPVAYAW